MLESTISPDGTQVYGAAATRAADGPRGGVDGREGMAAARRSRQDRSRLDTARRGSELAGKDYVTDTESPR